jgi:hypothetical protein
MGELTMNTSARIGAVERSYLLAVESAAGTFWFGDADPNSEGFEDRDAAARTSLIDAGAGARLLKVEVNTEILDVTVLDGGQDDDFSTVTYVLWGSSPDADSAPQRYEFDTPAELAAFRKGIEAMDGWMGYHEGHTAAECREAAGLAVCLSCGQTVCPDDCEGAHVD